MTVLINKRNPCVYIFVDKVEVSEGHRYTNMTDTSVLNKLFNWVFSHKLHDCIISLIIRIF